MTLAELQYIRSFPGVPDLVVKVKSPTACFLLYPPSYIIDSDEIQNKHDVDSLAFIDPYACHGGDGKCARGSGKDHLESSRGTGP